MQHYTKHPFWIMKAVDALFCCSHPSLFPFIVIIYPPSSSSGLTFISVSSSFSLSLPPGYSPPSLSSASFAVMIPLPPSWWTSHNPDLVVPGFQMVWLAEGSEPTLQQLILSYRKPQGGWQGTHFSGRMRGRGQGEGLGAEGGLYNSQSCHRPTRVLKRLRLLSALRSCLKLVHKHFTISQVLCRRQ